jgi:hypothetical protein
MPFVSGPSATWPSFYLGASVFANAGQAEAAFRRETRPAVAVCLTRTTVADFGSGFAGIKLALVSRKLAPLSGFAARVVALRLIFKAQTAPHVPMEEDLFVAHKGRTEAWLGVTSFVHLQRRITLEKQLLADLRMP